MKELPLPASRYSLDSEAQERDAATSTDSGSRAKGFILQQTIL